jgi:hypothetical protein
MRECRSSGSVEGVISDGHSYSDSYGRQFSDSLVYRRHNAVGRRANIAAWSTARRAHSKKSGNFKQRKPESQRMPNEIDSVDR